MATPTMLHSLDPAAASQIHHHSKWALGINLLLAAYKLEGSCLPTLIDLLSKNPRRTPRTRLYYHRDRCTILTFVTFAILLDQTRSRKYYHFSGLATSYDPGCRDSENNRGSNYNHDGNNNCDNNKIIKWSIDFYKTNTVWVMAINLRLCIPF